jgi:hypothetical protein
MAQTDSTLVAQPSLSTIQVHVPVGQGVTNNPADNPYVDPTQVGNSAGKPIVPVQVTVAGNVRFSNPG